MQTFFITLFWIAVVVSWLAFAGYIAEKFDLSSEFEFILGPGVLISVIFAIIASVN